MPTYQDQLRSFLGALREVESGGDYTSIRQVGSERLLGAYGFPASHWPRMAADAGFPNAPWQDRFVQDRVAEAHVRALRSVTSSWEAVGAAWFGGLDLARQVSRGGVVDAAGITDPMGNQLGSYLGRLTDFMGEVSDAPDSMEEAEVAAETGGAGGALVDGGGGEEGGEGGVTQSSPTAFHQTMAWMSRVAAGGEPILPPLDSTEPEAPTLPEEETVEEVEEAAETLGSDAGTEGVSVQ